MATAPVAATVTIHMGARAGQVARDATLTVRWRQVTLRPPNSRDKQKLPNITVWAVWAIETNPPPGVAPVEWLLLTTVPITSTAEALSRLEWYAARWGIEVWHKVLKSGCRIEDRQLEAAERLIRCLTLYNAWCELSHTDLKGRNPRSTVSLYNSSLFAKELTDDYRGHLPDHIVCDGRRL
jgi:hypothetical protein